MSLITSFNKNFLKENLKKSKGPVIFSLIIIPLITALIMIMGYKDYSLVKVFSWKDCSTLNLILMYILPFVFSNILFGFVYKRKSTDFINSMPVNKKTIFITNTIGGILLITIIQVLVAIILLICNSILNSVVILPQVILDMFIMMWMSYVFVFTATNLAMTISGTLMTQVVITALILFLVPICADCIDSFNSSKLSNNMFYNEFSIIDGDKEVYIEKINHLKNYTIPYKIIKYIGYKNIYSNITVVKMAVLSIIYFIIGLQLFKRRKMENCEESFISLKEHLILKTITLIPILMLANIEDSISLSIVTVVLLALYYFIYDLIIRKKVPLKISLVCFISSIIFLQIGITGINIAFSNFNENTINLEDIESVSFGKTNNTPISSFVSIYYNNKYFLNGEIYFKDDDLIKDIVYKNYEYNKEYDEYNNNYQYDDIYNTKSTYNYSDDSIKYIQVNFKLKSGKIYSGNLCFSVKELNNIKNKICLDENYFNTLKKYITEPGIIIINSKLLNNKDNKQINKILKD